MASPEKSQFLMTPDQHRRRAAQLRRSVDPEVRALADHSEALAMAIEKRLHAETASPPISPDGD